MSRFWGLAGLPTSEVRSGGQGGWTRPTDRARGQLHRPARSPTCHRRGDYAVPSPGNQCERLTRATSCPAGRMLGRDQWSPGHSSMSGATWFAIGTEDKWRHGGEAPRCAWDHRDHSRPTVPVRVSLRRSSFQVTSAESGRDGNYSVVRGGVKTGRNRGRVRLAMSLFRLSSSPGFLEAETGFGKSPADCGFLAVEDGSDLAG